VLGGEYLMSKVAKELGDGGKGVCLKWGFWDVVNVAIWFVSDSTCCWTFLCRRLVLSRILTV